MLVLPALSVPGTLNTLSASLSLLPLTLSAGLAAQLDSAASHGDSVAVYGGVISNATSIEQLTLINNISLPPFPNPVNPSGDNGRKPTFGMDIPSYPYLYAVRLAIGTPGPINLLVSGEEVPTGGGGGVASVTATAPIVSSGGANPNISAPTLGTPSKQNKNMVGSTTVADFQLACATPVAALPKGFVRVFLNGAAYDAGAKTDVCYFSSNGGVTALAQGAITAGALLYWVGSVAGFQVDATTDILDFDYNA